MPKPTTHTDIVVVTKQNPGLVESVQVMLTSEVATLKELYGVAEDSTEGPVTLDTTALWLEMDLNGARLALGYQLVADLDVAVGRFHSEPIPKKPAPPNTPQPPPAIATMLWRNAAPHADLKSIELKLLGGYNTPLTVVPRHYMVNGLTRLDVDIKSGRTIVGTLVMTASIDAALV